MGRKPRTSRVSSFSTLVGHSTSLSTVAEALSMTSSRNQADAASRRSKARIALAVLGAAVLIYGLTAYVLLPRSWMHYEHQKGLAGRPMVTRTSQDIPGDPINIGLVGTREDVL